MANPGNIKLLIEKRFAAADQGEPHGISQYGFEYRLGFIFLPGETPPADEHCAFAFLRAMGDDDITKTRDRIIVWRRDPEIEFRTEIVDPNGWYGSIRYHTVRVPKIEPGPEFHRVEAEYRRAAQAKYMEVLRPLMEQAEQSMAVKRKR
jgi:hypothetical protein